MRTNFTILLFALLSLCGFAKAADQMSVTINGTSTTVDALEVRNFEVGVQLFTNRTNMPISTIPSEFEGYKFLSFGGGNVAVLVGTITPLNDGYLYLAARNGNSTVHNAMVAEGWTKTIHTFLYMATSELVIYEKAVTANVAVKIPEIVDFRGAIPIAKNITLIKDGEEEPEIDSMTITINGKSATTDPLEVRSFAVDVQLFTNRTNLAISTIPAGFEGYKFLSFGADNTKAILSGTITSSADGYLYLAARNNTSTVHDVMVAEGWSKTSHTFFYATTSELVIYEKAVTAGNAVSIPQITDIRGAIPIAKEINLIQIIPADEMAITVEVTAADAGNFDKRTFTDGTQLFTNRTYTATGTPSQFDGFEFLASEGAKADKGIIIPSADGTIYLIGKAGGLSDWTLVNNSSFYYDATEMSIYQKTIRAGQRIEIPDITNFQGASCLAKNITVEVISANSEARLQNIIVDGHELSGFSMENNTYNYYLPYTYNQRPVVEYATVAGTADAILAETEDVRGTEDERTATITVTSQDGTKELVYKILFTVVPEMDLYLCIGQSNMAGYAPMDETKGDLLPMDNVYLFNTQNMFEQAANPLNKYSTVAAGSARIELGPSYSFAQTIKTRTEAPVGLVVNARGGSSIQNWTKGGTGDPKDTLYLPTITRALEAQKWGTFKGILWHQGEANKRDLDDYITRLQQLVLDLRTDLNDPQLLFLAGQIGRFGLDVDDFNNLITTISSHITNADWVSSENLGNIPGDNNHFNRDAAIELGKRYARKVSDTLYPITQMPVTVETDAGTFQKATLETGAAILIDRPAYTIANTDLYGFEGFEMLASNANSGGAVDESGVITPSVDGDLYVLADSTVALNGWIAMAGTEMSYYNRTLRVFRKKVSAGEKIIMPVCTDFRGVTPIAKSFTLIEVHPEEDTRLDNITVEGINLEGFNKDVKEYTYYLPYTATTTPAVSVVKHVEGASVTINNASDITSSENKQRTTVIEVTSQDNLNIAKYNVEFNVLPELDLFLCIGQSNMAGAAKLEADKGDLNLLQDAYLLNGNNKFEAARNGMNRYANVLTAKTEYYGLTHAFAKKLTSKIDKPIGLIVNARGGSSIQLWEKDGTGAGDTLYVKTMERALEAQAWGTYKAVLWHQGEANRTNHETIGYMNLLNELTANLRTDLGVSDLFFVAGEIGHWRSDNTPFNTMLRTIGQNIENSAYVVADDLINITNLADNDSHFNRQGLITLGERYADAVYDELYQGGSVSIDDKNEEEGISVTARGKEVLVRCNKDSMVQITDLLGRVVYTGNVREEAVIKVATSGIYIVVVENTSATKRVKLLLK